MKPFVNYKQVKCPHTREVERETGDWVTEGKTSYFKVDKVWTEIIPCGETKFNIVDKHPFSADSGIDPEGIEVECLLCKKRYYIFGYSVPIKGIE